MWKGGVVNEEVGWWIERWRWDGNRGGMMEGRGEDA